MSTNLSNIRDDEEEICNSQPISFSSFEGSTPEKKCNETKRPPRNTGQKGHFRCIEEIDPKYRHVFKYPYFNLVQSRVIDDALYSNKSMVVCAPTGSGKTVIFEMAILQLLMDLEDKKNTDDFKIIYMAPVKALCTERITEWYSKFMKLGLLCIEVTGDTDVDFPQLKPYRIIITTPEKWDMLTRRWMEHNLVKIVKLFLIDEVHILNDEARGPVLEAVVSRMKTVESSVRSGIRLVAVSATISNPEDVAAWLGAGSAPAVHYKFGDECRPVKLNRVVEGYPCSSGTSTFKFDIILNYKLWPIIQKYHNGKPTLIFCNTRKSVMLTAETLSREITVGFSPEQREKLIALASTIKNKKIQSLVVSGVGCHHAGLLFEERANIEQAFRNRELPILITTTTLAMGVNLPAHLVIIKNTQQYINGAYQEYSISTVLQMVGRAGRPQYDSNATAVIMTRLQDKARYQSLVGGSEPLQSFLHKRLAENINSEIALGTIGDVAQCVQWLNSTFLKVRVAKDPKRYLGLPSTAPRHLITKKIEELCVRALNGLESSGLVTMDELSCIESTEAGRLMSLHYLDLETMKLIMKIDGTETLEKLLWLVCESHELSDMHLRVDERRCLNALNRNNSAPTIRYQMKGKISSRQMKLNCVIQSVLGCLPIPDPSLNQEALKIMRTADRVCKCLVSYVTRPNLISQKPKFYTAILNALTLAKCITAHLWENSLYVSRQLRGIGPTFSTLLASAGKTNFMLLGESHPRDLERIMNKGPPAGNILRKQISLLPNYNITITPMNEQTIRIQLSLLNQSYLAENIDSLTAGSGHKSYIVVGDSENLLLYLSSFKDSDLINIYEGSISFEVSRKHLNEHKVIAHCISSSFVGIDNRCEYIFKNINPLPLNVENTLHNETPRKISPNRQTYITDVFKERKRKNNDKESPISKEKKKRESFSIDKFKTLQESFERTSKEIKGKCKESKVKTVLENSMGVQPVCNKTPEMVEPNFNEASYDIEEKDFLDDFEYNDIGNEHINNLVKEIEDEVNHPSKFNSMVFKVSNNNESNKNNSRTFNKEKTKFNVKDNYSFIDRLEKKNSECENDNLTSNKDVGFSDTIKSYVQEFFKQTKDNIQHSTTDIIKLVDKDIDVPNTSISECKESIYNKDIPEDIQHITNSDILRENVDIIDLTQLSPISTNYNISPESRIVPIKIKEAPLDNTELKLSQMQNETKTIDTIAKKSLVSAECSLIPYEPRIESQMNVSKELQTFERSCDIKISNVDESRDNHNKSLFSIYQNQNIPNDYKDIKKYSFNAIKTIGVHNENVSKICTLKVALDVTEIVHDNDKKCNDSKHIIKKINDHNNFDKVNTVLQLEDNINNKSLNTTNNRPIPIRQQQINEPPNIISDKSTIYSQDKNNETTLKDILNRYNKRLNDIQVEEIELDNSTSQKDKKNKNPEMKQKHKYRIRDLDTMDIILPDSLVPIRNQFINKTPVNYKSYNNNLYKSLPIIEERRKASTVNTNSVDEDLNITSNATYISEIDEEVDNDIYNSLPIIEEKPKTSTINKNNSLDEDLNLTSNVSYISKIDDEEDDSDEECKIDLNPYFEETLDQPDIDLYKVELDPKILLRSLNNDEILTPPPEFCDSDYSPISPLNTNNVIDLVSDDSNYNNIPLADNTFNDSRSSSDTNSWNFSRTRDNFFMYHPTSSHTIINRNPSDSSRSDFVKSRISKLSQFKFKRKEMLKK